MRKYNHIELPNLNKNPIHSTPPNPVVSNNFENPLLMVGQYEMFNKALQKLNIIENHKEKNKSGNRLYYVMNTFNKTIDDHADDIHHMAEKYFSQVSKAPIISNSFYELWELLVLFDLCSGSNITSLHLGDNGSFTQCTSYYRSKFKKQNKNDEFYYTGNEGEFNKDIKGSKLTDPKLNADFITSYNGKYTNNPLQEQQLHPNIIRNIKMALKHQKDGGNFVCHMSYLYTNTSLKLLCLLSSCYKKVHVINPLTTKNYLPSSYIVCLEFTKTKGNKLEEQLDEILDEMNKGHINEIYPDYHISQEFVNLVIKFNNKSSNNQISSIMDIFDYLKDRNYRGELYHRKRDEQIVAAEFWTSLFFPNNTGDKFKAVDLLGA